jgi:hypothetical protein
VSHIRFTDDRSDHMAAFVTRQVQPGVELVIIEYAVNDLPKNEPWAENPMR